MRTLKRGGELVPDLSRGIRPDDRRNECVVEADERSGEGEASVRGDGRKHEARHEDLGGVARLRRARTHYKDARRKGCEDEERIGDHPQHRPEPRHLGDLIKGRSRKEHLSRRLERWSDQRGGKGLQPARDRVDDLSSEIHYVPSTRRRMSTRRGDSAASA